MDHRYVDDTLLGFNGNTRELEILQNVLNNTSTKLKLTLKIESSNDNFFTQPLWMLKRRLSSKYTANLPLEIC